MTVLARLWSLRRERPVFVAVSLAFLGFLATWPFVDLWLRSIDVAGEFRFYDWGAYGAAVGRWLDGEAIYVTNENGGYHTTYLYPPTALLVFWPFTYLPETRLAWNVFSVGLLWVGLQAVVAGLDVRLSIPERGLLLWLLLGFQPLLLSLKLAQTTGFLAGVLCLSLAAMLRAEVRESRPLQYASAVLTAVAGAIKPSYSTVAAHVLADRDRIAGGFAAALGILLVSVLVFGVETHLDYLDVLAWGIHHGDTARSPALWLPPYFKPLYWIPGTVFGLSGSLLLRVIASLLIAVGALLAAPDADREVFALGLVAFPLLSPLTYAYYFAVAIPAVVVMVAVEFEREGRPVLPVIGLWILAVHSYGLRILVVEIPARVAWWDSFRFLYPLFQPGLWGCLLLIGLAAYRVKGSIGGPPQTAQ